jgi:hypothetical protein
VADRPAADVPVATLSGLGQAADAAELIAAATSAGI